MTKPYKDFTRVKNWDLDRIVDTYLEPTEEPHKTSLGLVPDEFRTPEVCRGSLFHSVENLQFFPDSIDQGYLESLIPEYPEIIQLLPRDRALRHLTNRPQLIRLLPESWIDEGTAMMVVQKEGKLLRYIPQPSPKICEVALRNDPEALPFIPNGCLTDKICRMALEGNPLAMELIPNNRKTESLCRLALRKSVDNVQHIPRAMLERIFSSL